MLWSDIFGSLVFSNGKPVGLLLNLYVPYTCILPQKPSTGFRDIPKSGRKIGVELAYSLACQP
jgi:hypothetical protein